MSIKITESCWRIMSMIQLKKTFKRKHTLLCTTAGAICMGIGLLCIIFQLQAINLNLFDLYSHGHFNLNHQEKGKELQV